ncbi:MAG: ABC transporter substrate-binding protein [Planctomycetota bacterium]
MRRRSTLRLLLALVGVGLISCAEPADYRDEHLRIVSLSPAITQVVIELGLADAIIAVGDYDELAPRGVPSLGRFNDLDLERLTTLAPTHVLATTGEVSLPDRVIQLGEAGRFALSDFDYPNDIAAALRLTRDVGVALGRAERVEELVTSIEHQLESIEALTAERDRPRALLVFATSPVMVSGPGTVNVELLRIAGGANAAADARVTAPVYDREALRALAPDAIFLMEPGGTPWAGPGDPRLDPFRGLDLPALQSGRVFVLNDPAVLLPGPSLATTAVSMAVALHPDLAGPIAEVFRDGS